MSPRLEETLSVTEQRYKVLAAIMLGGIMGPIDTSIVNVILQTITSFFGTPISTAQWVPLIYLLTIGREQKMENVPTAVEIEVAVPGPVMAISRNTMSLKFNGIRDKLSFFH